MSYFNIFISLFSTIKGFFGFGDSSKTNNSNKSLGILTISTILFLLYFVFSFYFENKDIQGKYNSLEEKYTILKNSNDELTIKYSSLENLLKKYQDDLKTCKFEKEKIKEKSNFVQKHIKKKPKKSQIDLIPGKHKIIIN